MLWMKSIEVNRGWNPLKAELLLLLLLLLSFLYIEWGGGGAARG